MKHGRVAVLLPVLPIIAAASCGEANVAETVDLGVSHAKQMVRGDCHDNTANRAEQVAQMIPTGVLRNWTASEKRRIANRLGSLPDGMLRQILVQGRLHTIEKRTDLGDGIAGRGGHGWVGLAPGQIDWALLHEVAHAVDGSGLSWILKLSERNTIIREMEDYRGQADLRMYGTKNTREAWAETFCTYFCSQKKKAFITDKLGAVGEIVERRFPAPYWEGGGGDGGGVENLGECSRNTQCRSGYCNTTCGICLARRAGASEARKGAWCTRDRQCESRDCSGSGNCNVGQCR